MKHKKLITLGAGSLLRAATRLDSYVMYLECFEVSAFVGPLGRLSKKDVRLNRCVGLFLAGKVISLIQFLSFWDQEGILDEALIRVQCRDADDVMWC